MKIALLIRTADAGGAERAATTLANEFARTGNTVTLLCLTGSSSFYPTDPTVIVRYLNKDAAGGRKRAKPAVLLRRARALRTFLRLEKPDVLVCMSWSTTLYGIACCKSVSTICIGTERANPFVLDRNRVTTFLRRFSAKKCAGFVCQTERAKTFYPAAAQAKIAVIPNGVFNPLVYETSVPNERDRVITACGRLDRNKGFDVLLDAFARVHAQEPDCTLRIFGEGESRAELTAQAERLHLSQSVKLCGADPGAIRPIARSSVFVLSSRSEGMPNALIEAMAAGVPCVATRCDMGPAELIEDGVNGLLVPVDDADAMAQAILRILRDGQLSETLSRNALRMRQTHDPSAVADLWLRYFEKCLRSRVNEV